MDDETKDKTYEPGMDEDDDESDPEYVEEDSDVLLEEDDDQFVYDTSEDEVVEDEDEEKEEEEKEEEEKIVNNVDEKDLASNSRSNSKRIFRVRKTNPSVDGGVIKPMLRKEKVPLKKESHKDNLQKTLSTPSKFNPKALKVLTSKLLKKQNEQLITEKKFSKGKFAKKRKIDSPGNQIKKRLFVDSEKEGRSLVEQEKKRLREEQKLRYSITFDTEVKVDKELSIQAKVLHGEEILFFTRKSTGYPEFFTILPMVYAIVLMEKLGCILKTDLSIISLVDYPIEQSLGGGNWLVISTDTSQYGNLYRAMRLESAKGQDELRRSKFHMNFASIYELDKALKTIIKSRS